MQGREPTDPSFEHQSTIEKLNITPGKLYLLKFGDIQIVAIQDREGKIQQFAKVENGQTRSFWGTYPKEYYKDLISVEELTDDYLYKMFKTWTTDGHATLNWWIEQLKWWHLNAEEKDRLGRMLERFIKQYK